MKLQKYDIILKKNSKSPISKLIQLATGDIYSHAMIVLDDLHILEATYPQGVQIKHIDFNLGEFDCYRYKGLKLTKEQEDNITEFIQKTINTDYDIKELFLQAFNIEDKSKNKYICISLALEIFKIAGLDVGKFEKGFKQVCDSDKFYKVN